MIVAWNRSSKRAQRKPHLQLAREDGVFLFGLSLILTRALFDDGLKERRGEETGELAVGRGVRDGQSASVGVDGGLIES
jgi:hypothetical protein